MRATPTVGCNGETDGDGEGDDDDDDDDDGRNGREIQRGNDIEDGRSFSFSF